MAWQESNKEQSPFHFLPVISYQRFVFLLHSGALVFLAAILTARWTEFILDTARCSPLIDPAGVGSVLLASLWSRSTA